MKDIYHINKPLGMSSNQAIQYIKKRTNIKKIGHAGTLDPLATGVLVIGINLGTKHLNNLTFDNKQYLVDIEFGYETDTLDIEGNITSKTNNIPVFDNIQNILSSNIFSSYMQVVPMFSAVKINGKELYKYARENLEIDNLPSKLVKLFNYKIIDYKNNVLTILIDVSKGFYVRSFARDLAYKLNSLAIVKSLKRLKSGEFSIDNAYELDEFINFYNQNHN